MHMTKPKPGRLDDTLNLVAREIEEYPEIPMNRLREIAVEVSVMVDPETMRLCILELAGIA